MCKKTHGARLELPHCLRAEALDTYILWPVHGRPCTSIFQLPGIIGWLNPSGRAGAIS